MQLKDGMILYHGSYTVVEEIILEKCSKNKDFGQGFYLTSDFEQSRNFIKTSLKKAQNFGIVSATQNYGFVSSFVYHQPESDINVHIFDNANREWLWFIAKNRREKLAEILSCHLDLSEKSP